jgi:hypothetical protein
MTPYLIHALLITIIKNAIPPYALRIRDHLTECCPELDQILHFKHPKVPPWKIQQPVINLSMNTYNKEKDNPIVIKTAFYELLEQYTDYTHIYTDGSKTDTAVAAAAVCNHKTLKCHLPNSTSIYTAELYAIILAYKFINKLNHTHFLIQL